MQSTLKRLAAVAAVGTIGILAPTAGASTAITTGPSPVGVPGAGFPATGPGFHTPNHAPKDGPGETVAFGLGVGTRPVPLLAGPGTGHVTTVVGPTIITTTPSTFINANNQVSPATQAAP